jgi:hypothetical protein
MERKGAGNRMLNKGDRNVIPKYQRVKTIPAMAPATGSDWPAFNSTLIISS